MKKLLLLFAVLLPCSLAHSQEAEENGKYADFQLIPRFDFNPYFTPGQTGDGSSGYTFGNSSIYTLVEGAFSDNVSFTFSNHWLTGDYWTDTPSLYKNTLYSNTNNWVDIAKFDFTFDNWTFTVGKDCLVTGGFEYDDWDVDVDYLFAGESILMASKLWYDFPCYQWGGKVGYSIGEHTSLALQMATSPFGERPFASGQFAYSFKWDGNYGPFSNMWSVSAVQKADKSFDFLLALSQQVELGDFTIGLDWYNVNDVDYDEDDSPCGLMPGSTFRPRVGYAPLEWFNCKLIGNIYTEPGSGVTDMNIGAAFHFLPIENIQLHTALAWDLTTKAVSVMAGVKVNFTFLSL